MIDNQQITTDIQDKKIKAFKKKFLKDHGVHLYIYASGETEYKIDLPTFEECALVALKKEYPIYNYMENMKYRTREKPYIIHSHVMCYLAWHEGHSKTSIAKFLCKNHATVINSVKQIDNALFTKDKDFINALNNTLKELETYVGTVPENFKSQLNSQSSSDPIWNQARDFLKRSN